MRTIIIVIILAVAAFSAYFLLRNKPAATPEDEAAAAKAALDQLGQNKLEEMKLENLDNFYSDEFDECYKACKKSKCGWFARKCKGRCKTDCLEAQASRHGLSQIYNPTTGVSTKPAKVREYNPLAAS